MKSALLIEIERIAGDRLTPEMREEIADCAVKIMEGINKKAALVALEIVKETIIDVTNSTEKAS